VTALDFAASEQKRQLLFQRFANCFEFTTCYHAAIAGKAVSGEMKLSDPDQRQEARHYTELDRRPFLITLMTCPRQRAGRPDQRRPCRSASRSSARASRAAARVGYEDRAANPPDRLAASRVSEAIVRHSGVSEDQTRSRDSRFAARPE